MNKIKVYLQYPWKFPDSPYYKYLIDSPIEGIEFQNTKKQKGVITSKRFFWFSNFLKGQIRFWFKKLKLTVPNAHLTPKGDCDLIHCAHCLSKNKDKPWVADIEMVFALMVSWNNSKKAKRKVRKILLGDNCKKILAWTNETKKEIIKNFPETGPKIETVYPAVPLIQENKKEHKKINLLFVGRYFYPKGGLDSLKVIDALTKKYKNVFATFVSQTPKKYLEKYSKNKKIKFYELMPQKELFKIQKEADILIYPGYSDSFGFAYLEAMSFGIPIVTVDGFARKEIIDEGKTGFVIDLPKNFIKNKRHKLLNKKIVRELVEKSSILIEDKKLRKKMSKECIKTIKDGKFSIKERDKKLKRIYREALK